MRDIAERIATCLVAIFVVATGLLASLAFLCYAAFAYLATIASPALAALMTASLALFAALAVALALNGWRRGHGPVRGQRHRTDEALGTLLAAEVGTFAAKYPGASLLLSLAAGFVVGARSRRGA